MTTARLLDLEVTEVTRAESSTVTSCTLCRRWTMRHPSRDVIAGSGRGGRVLISEQSAEAVDQPRAISRQP